MLTRTVNVRYAVASAALVAVALISVVVLANAHPLAPPRVRRQCRGHRRGKSGDGDRPARRHPGHPPGRATPAAAEEVRLELDVNAARPVRDDRQATGYVNVTRARPPFIVIRTRDGFVIVNLQDEPSTRALYESIAARWPDLVEPGT